MLDKPVNQSEFASIVGVSRQAIQKKSSEIGLVDGQPFRVWIKLYCEHLRESASGRGADNSASLTQQRIQESEQKTLSLAIANSQSLGSLCPTDDVVMAFNELGQTIPVSINNAGEKILETLASKLELDIDDELVYEPLRSAGERIAKNAGKLGQRFVGVREESEAFAPNSNGAVG